MRVRREKETREMGKSIINSILIHFHIFSGVFIFIMDFLINNFPNIRISNII